MYSAWQQCQHHVSPVRPSCELCSVLCIRNSEKISSLSLCWTLPHNTCCTTRNFFLFLSSSAQSKTVLAASNDYSTRIWSVHDQRLKVHVLYIIILKKTLPHSISSLHCVYYPLFPTSHSHTLTLTHILTLSHSHTVTPSPAHTYRSFQ